MKLSYLYHGKKYMFVWFETEYGPGKIAMVCNANTDNEKIVFIKCYDKYNYSIKINKKSLSSDGAAYGVMRFLKWSIDNDICTCYVNNIINHFA